MTAIDHKYELTLPSDMDAAFAALTEAKALRVWFAQGCGGDLKPGATVKLEGRGAVQPGEVRVTAAAKPSKLAFDWPLYGADSHVEFALSRDEDKTKLAIRHNFPHGLNLPRAKDWVDDLWRLHGTNLSAYLEGGAPALLPDFADPAPKVELSIWIDAPRATVFRALMDPKLLHAWVNNEWVEQHKTIVEPRVGGAYVYGWKYEVAGRPVDGGPTKILELVVNERLVTDWTDWRGDPEVPPQRIAWILKDENGGTRLTMTHDRFVRVVDISDYGGGWQYFLGAIKGVAEKGPV